MYCDTVQCNAMRRNAMRCVELDEMDTAVMDEMVNGCDGDGRRWW